MAAFAKHLLAACTPDTNITGIQKIHVKRTDGCIVDSATVQCGGSLPTFQRTPLSASSAPKFLTKLYAPSSALRMETAILW